MVANKCLIQADTRRGKGHHDWGRPSFGIVLIIYTQDDERSSIMRRKTIHRKGKAVPRKGKVENKTVNSSGSRLLRNRGPVLVAGASGARVDA
jgi:hypothetical protein